MTGDKMMLRLVLAVSLLLTGCIHIPTGEMRRNAISRRPISNGSLRSLKPGMATRTMVLLALGAPEVSLEDETYFLYYWETETGFLRPYSGEFRSLNTSHHDLLFKFDDTGLIVQSGELKSLLADGFGRDEPAPPEASSTIPVKTRWKGTRGRFVLHPGEMELELTGGRGEDFSIPPGGALVLDYRTSRESFTSGDWRPYDLKFRDRSGEVHEVGLQIQVGSLIPLARYLHQHSPGIQIHD